MATARMLHPEADPSSAKALSSTTASPDGEDYYAKLGVTIINATGTYTHANGRLHAPRGIKAFARINCRLGNRAVMGTLR